MEADVVLEFGQSIIDALEPFIEAMVETYEAMIEAITDWVNAVCDQFIVPFVKANRKRCRFCGQWLTLDQNHHTCLHCGGPPRSWQPQMC